MNKRVVALRRLFMWRGVKDEERAKCGLREGRGGRNQFRPGQRRGRQASDALEAEKFACSLARALMRSLLIRSSDKKACNITTLKAD